MFCNRSYDAGNGSRLPCISRSIVISKPEGQLLAAALPDSEPPCRALLPPGVKPQKLRLGDGGGFVLS